MHGTVASVFADPRLSYPWRGQRWALAACLRLMMALLLVVPGTACWRGSTTAAAPGLAVDSARAALERMDFVAARRIYRQLDSTLSPDSPFWPEATYGYAITLWQDPASDEIDLLQAEYLLDRLAKTGIDAPLAASAQLGHARLLMLRYAGGESHLFGQIEQLLRALMDQVPGLIRHEAALRLAELYQLAVISPGIQADAAEHLESWLARYPFNPLAIQMREILGYVYLRIHDRPLAALDAWRGVLEEGLFEINDPARLLWIAANLARDAGLRDEARRYFARLAADYPQSGWAAESTRSLLLLQ